jgi:hypothetical protein
MKHFLLRYHFVSDFLRRREEVFGPHMKLAWDACRRGELLLGGTLADPAGGAVLLFKGDGPEAAERFAREDPYVVHGLVTKWSVTQWLTVVGDGAAEPLRLGS